MIEIAYCPEQNRLLVEGHAGFDLPGKDPVCAGASMLVQTYAAVCNSMDKLGWTTKPTQVSMEPGRARIKAFPSNRTCYAARCKLDAIAEGLALLADHYPQYVNFKID